MALAAATVGRDVLCRVVVNLAAADVFLAPTVVIGTVAGIFRHTFPIPGMCPRVTMGERARFPFCPDLIWPTDRSWFLSTDTELSYSYVGASRSLVDELLSTDSIWVNEVTAKDPANQTRTTAHFQGRSHLVDFERCHRAPADVR